MEHMKVCRIRPNISNVLHYTFRDITVRQSLIKRGYFVKKVCMVIHFNTIYLVIPAFTTTCTHFTNVSFDCLVKDDIIKFTKIFWFFFFICSCIFCGFVPLSHFFNQIVIICSISNNNESHAFLTGAFSTLSRLKAFFK